MASDQAEGICDDFKSAPRDYEEAYRRWGNIGPRSTISPNQPACDRALPGDLRCILDGWAFRQAVLPDGRRVVRDFLIPGDVIGHWKDRWPRAFKDTIAATPLTCATVSTQVLSRDPDLKEKLEQHLEAALITETALLNGIVLRLGGMTVAERVIHLFLELLERHRHAELTRDDAFPLPIPQDLLADSLGIGRVHLNRTLQELRGEGLISLANGRLELRRLPELIRLVDYESLYAESCLA